MVAQTRLNIMFIWSGGGGGGILKEKEVFLFSLQICLQYLTF